MCRLALFLCLLPFFNACVEKNEPLMVVDLADERAAFLIQGTWTPVENKVLYNNTPMYEYQDLKLRFFMSDSILAEGIYTLEGLPFGPELDLWRPSGTWRFYENDIGDIDVGILIFDDKTEPFFYAKTERMPRSSLVLEYSPNIDQGRIQDFYTGWSFTFELQPSGN